jgi:hypothetical protein
MYSWTLDQQEILSHLKTKKIVSAYSDHMCCMTFTFEYLSEFELIFENNLG